MFPSSRRPDRLPTRRKQPAPVTWASLVRGKTTKQQLQKKDEETKTAETETRPAEVNTLSTAETETRSAKVENKKQSVETETRPAEVKTLSTVETETRSKWTWMPTADEPINKRESTEMGQRGSTTNCVN